MDHLNLNNNNNNNNNDDDDDDDDDDDTRWFKYDWDCLHLFTSVNSPGHI